MKRIGLSKDVSFEELYTMLSSMNKCEKNEEEKSDEEKMEKNGGGGGGGGAGGGAGGGSVSSPFTTALDDERSQHPFYYQDPNNTVSMYENNLKNSFSIRDQDVVHLDALRERWRRTTRTTSAPSSSSTTASTSTSTSSTTSTSTSTTTMSWGSTLEGCGSLNTTFHYGDFNGTAEDLPKIDMLHDYYRSMEDLCDGCSEMFDLNRRLYLLWKFKHYVTSYHQDTHITPHFTLYSQTSGCSSFHFLPILVGLFVTHQGTTIGNSRPEEIQQILTRLDDLKIGTVATIGPGQMALIMPSGSHGVFVPLVERSGSGSGSGSGSESESSNGGRNSHLGVAPFDVSLIRAAELMVAPLQEDLNRMLSTDDVWNVVLPMTKEEKLMLKMFEETQQHFMNQSVVDDDDDDDDEDDDGDGGGGGDGGKKMTKEEWFWCAQKMWQKWERKG